MEKLKAFKNKAPKQVHEVSGLALFALLTEEKKSSLLLVGDRNAQLSTFQLFFSFLSGPRLFTGE